MKFQVVRSYSWLLDTDPRAALFAARLLAHYPERLSRCLLVDAPAVFSGTYSAVRRVLNEGTASKTIVFVKSGDALAADVESWASEPLRHWLLAEMEENRQPWSQERGGSFTGSRQPATTRAAARTSSAARSSASR
ncbi:unnamed protein product [Effrenium voratum]|nr:unnamed protein product [Effrenium voratum]